MTDYQDLMKNFCAAGAEAIDRYTDASGEYPANMPEYFMPAFILNRLGDSLCATLETGFSKLAEWDRDARKRLGQAQTKHLEQNLLELANHVRRPRVDMVLFQSSDATVSKDQFDFFAIVEFKKGWISYRDRDKLLSILPYIETCPYGIVCGWTKEYPSADKHRAELSGDEWFEAETAKSRNGTSPYYFCARLFDRDKKG